MTVKIRCTDDTRIKEMQADKIAYCNNGTIRFLNVIKNGFATSFRLDEIVAMEVE